MPAISAKTRDIATAAGFGILAFIFRIWHLGSPKGFIFDEVYYAKNARSLLLHGVEIDPKTNGAEFIVHPPVGKWIIALGIKVFGYNEFGWRISSAVIGTITIVIFFFVVRRLFNNYFLSVAGTVLISADGLQLVHSRVALLDLYLMFFLLLGFLFLIYSRHWQAGISFGLAAACKWSGLYSIAAYLLFVLYVDYRSNRAMERDKAFLVTLKEKLLLRGTQYVIVPIVTYTVSWTGWFLTQTGYDRTWADGRKSTFSFIPAPIRSWWHYHAEILNFHETLTTKHSYSANPWSWLIMGRPTSMFYASPKNCGAPNCSSEVLALGTPLLWWAGVFAILALFGYWITRREWQSGLILLSIAAAYLPWFLFQKRTMFTFYAIAFEPFIILALVYCIRMFVDSKLPERVQWHRKIMTSAFIFVIVLNFLWFLPLFNGAVISYHSWYNMMWFPSWI